MSGCPFRFDDLAPLDNYSIFFGVWKARADQACHLLRSCSTAGWVLKAF